MSALLSAELLKLRTTRTFLALVGAALALSLLVVILTGVLSKRISDEQARSMFAFDFTGMFIMLLGVMGMSGEWRHRTITGTILASPNRISLLVAKVIAYALAGIVLSLIVTLALIFVGTLILELRDIKTTIGFSDYIDVLWRNLLVAALLGALGVCVGAVLRNQIVALVILVMLFLIVEPTLIGLVPDVGKFGPLQGAPGGIVDVNPTGDPSDANILLAPGIATLVMLGWLSLFFAASVARMRRFDLV